MLYPVVVEVDLDNQAYGVQVPDVAGCFSAGTTFADALENVKEALGLHFEGMVEDGEEIPFPSSIDKHINNDDYSGMVWAVVDIDVSRYLGTAKKINVTLPSRLIQMIDDHLKHDTNHASRSAFLAQGAELLLRNYRA